MDDVVAIDSGGTHTAMRFLRADGAVSDLADLSVSLGTSHSDAEIEAAFSAMFDRVRSVTEGRPAAVWISAAGYSQATCARFDALLERAAKGGDLVVGISNDADALVLAHDEHTIVVISGTGSVAKARGSDGTVLSDGDDDWIVADYGSGFWIGLSGIRHAYRALAEGKESVLLGRVLETYGPELSRHDVADSTRYREIARGLAGLGTGVKAAIASFARCVTDEAEQGDAVSQAIVREAADDLAASADRVSRQLAAHDELSAERLLAPVVLSGAIAYRSSFFTEAFRSSLELRWFARRRRTGRPVELHVQADGLAEVTELARRLSTGEPIPRLDETHPQAVFSAR